VRWKAQGKYEDAANAARDAMKSAGAPRQRNQYPHHQSDRRRDFASAVAHWKAAGPAARTEALAALKDCDGFDGRYGVADRRADRSSSAPLGDCFHPGPAL